MRENNAVKSAYVHIPFCKKICSYCDFCKGFYDEKKASKYIDALEKEISSLYKKELLDTLFVGGGTPSALSFKNLSKLFKVLNTFKLNKDYEFTFECNYEDITSKLLCLLKKNKVNRLSIGIQTFNFAYETVLNRSINRKKMINSVKLCKKYFDNVNIDLMYALPNQKISDLKKDLNEIVKLNVNHVSTYALIVEEHTNLYIKDIKQIDDDTQNKMYYEIVNTLEKNGYVHYELSNFSLKNFESRHNLVYWNNEQYYGFGAGASSFLKNVRYDNTKSVDNYINGKRIIYEEKLSKKRKIEDEVMLSLRKINGINKDEFKNKYNVSFNDVFNYKGLISDCLLKENKSNIYIPKNKLFVSNEIIIRLLDTYTLNK